MTSQSINKRKNEWIFGLEKAIDYPNKMYRNSRENTGNKNCRCR